MRSFAKVTAAESVNQKRFEIEILEKVRTKGKSVVNYWDSPVTYNGAGFSFEELFYASGDSTLTSSGSFNITIDKSKVNVTGIVKHRWHDTYDWHVGWQVYIPLFGSIPDAAMKKLATEGHAKEYKVRCSWRQSLEANFELGAPSASIRWNWRIVL